MADRLSVLKYYLYYKYKKRFSDRSALKRWQVEKIRKHLEYVGDHSRLYKGMKKLSSYPVIDKKFMMEHFQKNLQKEMENSYNSCCNTIFQSWILKNF
jgi:hypothetical protein